MSCRTQGCLGGAIHAQCERIGLCIVILQERFHSQQKVHAIEPAPDIGKYGRLGGRPCPTPHIRPPRNAWVIGILAELSQKSFFGRGQPCTLSIEEYKGHSLNHPPTVFEDIFQRLLNTPNIRVKSTILGFSSVCHDDNGVEYMNVLTETVEKPEFREAIDAMMHTLGLEELAVLGHGYDGYAARLSDGSVLKVTSSPEEATAALMLMEADEFDMMQIYVVGRCTAELFIIVREDAADLDIPPGCKLQHLHRTIGHLGNNWHKPAYMKRHIELMERCEDSCHDIIKRMYDALRTMDSMFIEPNDICLDNMGITESGDLVLRDMGSCLVPKKLLTQTSRMEIGTIVNYSAFQGRASARPIFGFP